MAKKQEERTVTLQNGEVVKATFPVVVSASRSTDIPAFYADWFFHRLEQGYSAWTNPFNGVKSYVSYEDTKFIVFWSKNPRPLLEYLDKLKSLGIGCYIQYTLNDYESEGFEKSVRPLSERIETFKLLVDRLGKGAVVWRFDPLILTDKIDIDSLLRKIANIGDQLKGYTEKLVFSFADIMSYRKVKSNLEKNKINYIDWSLEQMKDFAQRLIALNKEKGWNYQLATCGEAANLEGVEHNHCVDDRLIVRFGYNSPELLKFLGAEFTLASFFDVVSDDAIQLPDGRSIVINKNNKDKGQRIACGCMKSKDIGEYNTCPHLCVYCYANSSKEIAINNWKRHKHNPLQDTITGVNMYQDEILKYSPLTIADIIKSCRSLVPKQYKQDPWNLPEINRGISVLRTEDGLNCYMAAYGEVHAAKAFKAIDSISIDKFSVPFEIFDWGCGQGMATLCLIEYLRKRNLLHNVKKITLVEPSIAAISRAAFNISRAESQIPIVTIKKGLPVTPGQNLQFESISDIDVCQNTVVHLFSNILDIGTINLKSLASLISSKGQKHVVACFGPAKLQEDRINSFCNYFDKNEITSLTYYRNTEFYTSKSYRRHTFGCFIRNFEFSLDSGKPVIIPYRFYAPKQYFAGYKSDLLDQLSENPISFEETAFEVLAPFDIGASVYDDVNPIIAVLNNLVERGLPTKASPWLEAKFAEVFGISEATDELGTIRYELKQEVRISDEIAILIRDVPLAVARLQKTILEALLTQHISFETATWKVLVKENDVPCAAIAFEELKQMFNHLVSATRDYSHLTFPEVELYIINSKYKDSPLHLDKKVYTESDSSLREQSYDMVIDFAIHEKTKPLEVAFSEFKANNNCYFNVRSSESIYGERFIYTTDRIVYKPLTKLNSQGTHDIIHETTEHLKYFVQLLFRKYDFREGQLPIISRALQLKSVIGLLPTGGGKSLTYQISALLQPGVSIIVDPLMSLMKDQYDGLINNGIDFCTYINSSVQDKAERENMMKESKVLFVFLSPERLSILRFRESLRAMADNHVYFSYGIIDEVHCVSEWGHDFRFSYLHLGRNLYNCVLPKQTEDESINHITLVGLTATASFDVLADVERELSGSNAFPLDPDATVRYENTNRLELQYRILKVDDDFAYDKWDVYKTKNKMVPSVVSSIFYDSFTELLEDKNIATIKERFISRENIDSTSEQALRIKNQQLNISVNKGWYKNAYDTSSAIIFCPHRVGALGVRNGKRLGIAGQLRQSLGIESVSEFVGGDSPVAQDEFIQGKTNIMVATKAFGMGIDKPHVRFTLNINHSGSLEAFVQEAGRAGRDKKMALAVILYSDKIFNEQDETTRCVEPIAVDYGVHKFFYDGNFLGEKTEWTVMNYLMNHQQAVTQETDTITRQSKTVSGFLQKLNETKDGQAVVSYISYKYPSQDSQNLDRFLIQQKLKSISNQPKSPKDNTEKLRAVNEEQYQAALMKAIYRMCCIGLIDDFTQDYVNHEFRIVTIKKPNGEYYKGLKQFFMRYYNEDKAKELIRYCKEKYKGTEIENCLYFLTQFIYRKIATKRKQAIQDIEQFCKDATSETKNWLEVNEDLKDYLYYYFNSKYARKGYQDGSGRSLSLIDDTDSGKNFFLSDNNIDPSMGKSFETSIVAKYMNVVTSDDVSSPKDNIKHLQGAVRLIRRGILSVNPALSLLNVFCLLFLKADEASPSLNEEFENSYLDGYIGFREALPTLDFYEFISEYKQRIIQLNITDEAHIERLESLGLMAEASVHNNWLNNFSKSFIS